MASVLFTALALIAAGQGGNVPAAPATTQARTTGSSDCPAEMRANARTAVTERRRHG